MSAQPDVVAAPELPAALRLRRHGAGSVRVTGEAGVSLVISGLTETEVRAVVALGSASRHPRDHPRARVPSARWSSVLTLLHAAAARLSLRGRPSARVVVLGDGPLSHELRRTLEPIVLRVIPEPEALAALDGVTAIHPPDLVVMPALDAVAALAGREWQRRGVGQLPVIVSAGLLTVGPLVQPGAGPCLGCLDLHRGARDPGWADWQASRATGSDADRDLDPPPELRAAAAALVALIVSGQQSGQPLPIGLSLSIRLPQPRVHHHLWTRHPACCKSVESRATMNG